MADQLSAAMERLNRVAQRLGPETFYDAVSDAYTAAHPDHRRNEFAFDLRLILAYLRAQEAMPIPTRWRWVPEEPTEAMIEAARIPIQCRRDCTVSKVTAKDAYRAMLSVAPAPPALEQFAENAKCSDQAVWKPIETAPKDGTWVLAIVGGASDRWKHLNGRAFVIRHEGKTPSGFDLGWSVYPGFGGTGDQWFTHWMPLPAPPLTEGE